jgi:hypothetical protein
MPGRPNGHYPDVDMIEMKFVIGVDFDNTIVGHDDLVYKVARERGLIDPVTPRNKRVIRDAIRRLPEGDAQWQQVQGTIYGPRLREAVLIEGVERFFKLCTGRGLPVFIVSHKTVSSRYDATGADLRKEALAWLRHREFFSVDGMGLTPNHVFFESTRREKIERIKLLGCTHFIDDLEETFLDESFPDYVIKVLYDPHRDSRSLAGVTAFSSWHRIVECLFP